MLSIIYFIGQGKKIRGSKGLLLACVLFLLFCVLGNKSHFAFWEKNLTYEGESIYNYLQVAEDEKQVRLSTNVLFGVQSVYQKEEGLTGMYYDYAMAAPLMVEEKKKKDVLILGMRVIDEIIENELKYYKEIFKEEGIKGLL